MGFAQCGWVRVEHSKVDQVDAARGSCCRQGCSAPVDDERYGASHFELRKCESPAQFFTVWLPSAHWDDLSGVESGTLGLQYQLVDCLVGVRAYCKRDKCRTMEVVDAERSRPGGVRLVGVGSDQFEIVVPK